MHGSDYGRAYRRRIPSPHPSYMSAELTIQPEQVSQLSKVLEVSGADMESLVSQCESVRWMQAQELEEGFAAALKSDDLGKSLCRLVMGWRALSFHTSESIETIVEALRSGLVRAVGGSDVEIVSKFDERREIVLRLLKSKAVRRVAKVLSLSYEYANLYQSAKIITDVRPIYDEEGKTFDDAVVTYTLSLRYDSSEGEHGLSLALDWNDLVRLQGECARAILKATAAKDFMASKGIQTVISGEDKPTPST